MQTIGSGGNVFCVDSEAQESFWKCPPLGCARRVMWIWIRGLSEWILTFWWWNCSCWNTGLPVWSKVACGGLSMETLTSSWSSSTTWAGREMCKRCTSKDPAALGGIPCGGIGAQCGLRLPVAVFKARLSPSGLSPAMAARSPPWMLHLPTGLLGRPLKAANTPSYQPHHNILQVTQIVYRARSVIEWCIRAKPPRCLGSSDFILNLNTIGYSYRKFMVVVLEGARGFKGVQFSIPEKFKGIQGSYYPWRSGVKPNGTPLPFCLLTTLTPQFH